MKFYWASLARDIHRTDIDFRRGQIQNLQNLRAGIGSQFEAGEVCYVARHEGGRHQWVAIFPACGSILGFPTDRAREFLATSRDDAGRPGVCREEAGDNAEFLWGDYQLGKQLARAYQGD